MSRSPPPPETRLRRGLVGSPGAGLRCGGLLGSRASWWLLPGPPCERSGPVSLAFRVISPILLQAGIGRVLLDVGLPALRIARTGRSRPCLGFGRTPAFCRTLVRSPRRRDRRRILRVCHSCFTFLFAGSLLKSTPTKAAASRLDAAGSPPHPPGDERDRGTRRAKAFGERPRGSGRAGAAPCCGAARQPTAAKGAGAGPAGGGAGERR